MIRADTIAAVSTSLSAAARAVVRISGAECFRIASKLFRGPPLVGLKKYAALEGRIELDGCPVDASLYVMRAPRSYTREDIIEFHIAGSPALAGMLMDALLKAGARPAGPGEFTQRAFLAGRIDLAQAEAVLKIVRAADDVHHRAALAQLHGALSRTLHDASEAAAQALALVELRIDFSDQDIEYIAPEAFRTLLSQAQKILANLENSSHLVPPAGALPTVALAGRTNAGKSSLVNALVGRSAAIVHHRPGTTRDYVEAHLKVDEMELLLVDTAGAKGAADQVGRAARRQARRAFDSADLILVTVDGTRGVGALERGAAARAGPRAIVVVTKRDIAPPNAADRASVALGLPVTETTSALTLQGVPELARALAERLALQGGDTARARTILTARQMDAVRRALTRLSAAIRADSEEIVALETREALECLGLITGTRIGDDVLERIFGEFCIGK